MAKFEKGNSGKPKGALNKTTRTVKETFASVFNEREENPELSLFEWSKTNPTEFYKLASKLIPTEVNANIDGKITTFNVGFKKPNDTED